MSGMKILWNLLPKTQVMTTVFARFPPRFLQVSKEDSNRIGLSVVSTLRRCFEAIAGSGIMKKGCYFHTLHIEL